MAELVKDIITKHNKNIINSGEMVGTLAAQSICEPLTQMTLNTFHATGLGSAVTCMMGIPRVKETGSVSTSKESVVNTLGCNLIDIQNYRMIDALRTTTDDLYTIYKFFGIEAAVFGEIDSVSSVSSRIMCGKSINGKESIQ